jgi:uncharacterized integral membrane protein
MLTLRLLFSAIIVNLGYVLRKTDQSFHGRTMKRHMKPKTIAILVVLFLFLIVLFQNSQAVRLQILFWEITRAPTFLIIGVTLLMGLLIGWFGHLLYARGKRSVRSTVVPPGITSRPKPDIPGIPE